jgi:aerobic C4-dicarboxylate transport protein
MFGIVPHACGTRPASEPYRELNEHKGDRCHKHRKDDRAGTTSDPRRLEETMTTTSPDESQAPPRRDRTHFLYVAVIVAMVLGITVGFVAPEFAAGLKWIGEAFVALIRMMIQPVIFCTLVLGVGSVRSAASVGKVGGLALGYFITMSTVALAIGLVVGNIIDPGQGLELNDEVAKEGAAQAEGAGSTTEFIVHIVPDSLFSSLTSGDVLQTLLVALLVGFALQAMGRTGEPILNAISHLQRLVFRVLAMVMWAAPIGAFGAIAAVVGETGVDALKSLAVIMIAFYITCFIFVFVVLGAILKFATGVNILSLFRYLAREFLLILSTSSSESALPRVIAKMEHAGVDQTTVGVVIPTGYSFNLDGTAIYLTMASIFIADAMGNPLSIGEQISLLLFMIIASKGAAGVTGAGLATLAGGLASHRPDLVDGVGLIVGIDRFMSEARALTNFAGNSVATVLVGHWTGTYNREQLDRVLAGDDPFDEMTMIDDDHSEGDRAKQLDSDTPSRA